MNSSFISSFLLLSIVALSSAVPQWGGWGNNNGGTEVIERDITTINNPWGGSETIEKDVVIENNNNRGGWGGNNGWNNGGWNTGGGWNNGGYGGYGRRWGRK